MGGDRTRRYDPKRRHRRSIRLKGYDYTQPGAYFVTICTHNRAPLFGRVVDGDMVLNVFGEMVWEEWFRTAQVRPYVELFSDEFVVMPNHVHGIIWIMGDPLVGAQRRCAPTKPKPGGITPNNVALGSLGAIIRSFKSAVTRRINEMRDTPGARVWQRNYYEHIVRSEQALDLIRQYIIQNPLRWHLDRYNPDRQGTDPLAHEIWNMIQTPVGAQRRCAPTNGQNGGEGHE